MPTGDIAKTYQSRRAMAFFDIGMWSTAVANAAEQVIVERRQVKRAGGLLDNRFRSPKSCQLFFFPNTSIRF
jgi:hypothetical protein